MRSLLIILLALVFLPLTACNSSHNSLEKKVVDLGSAEGCDSSVQSCLLAREGIKLQLELEKNLRTLQPFHLQLHIEGIEQPVEEVTVEFFMEGMEMGLNRYRLLYVENVWQGEITLPVCVAGRSDWRALVVVNSQQSRYRGVFRFHSSG